MANGEWATRRKMKGRILLMDLSQMTVSELLRLYADVLNDLRRRGVTRSSNNPVADYTEHLVCTRLQLERVANSTAGLDAKGLDGHRYQIKGRRLTTPNGSTELSAIRNLPERLFDSLIAVIYRPDFTIDYAGRVPHDVVVRLAKYSGHTNAHRFLMRRSVLEFDGVEDITAALT
jgi:hypothetical protein